MNKVEVFISGDEDAAVICTTTILVKNDKFVNMNLSKYSKVPANRGSRKESILNHTLNGAKDILLKLGYKGVYHMESYELKGTTHFWTYVLTDESSMFFVGTQGYSIDC